MTLFRFPTLGAIYITIQNSHQYVYANTLLIQTNLIYMPYTFMLRNTCMLEAVLAQYYVINFDRASLNMYGAIGVAHRPWLGLC